MQSFKILAFLGIILVGTSLLANAQDKAAIEQKLTSKYALTKTTADKTDIVTAGAILVLKKDNLMMVDATSSNLFQNTYKDGRITQNALGKLSRFHLPGVPAAPSSGAAQRTFVAGEKVWVTKIEVKDNGVKLELYSDAINDVRYRAVLSFPFKGSAPIEEQAEKMIAEVFDVQPSDDSGGNGGQQQAPADGARSNKRPLRLDNRAGRCSSAADPSSAASCGRTAAGSQDDFVGPDEGHGRGQFRPARENCQGRHQGDLLLSRSQGDFR